MSASRAHVASSLQSGARQGGSPVRQRLRSTLVILEASSAVVLLIGAGLLIDSFVEVLRVPAGFTRRRPLHREDDVQSSALPVGRATPRNTPADDDRACRAPWRESGRGEHAYPARRQSADRIPARGRGWRLGPMGRQRARQRRLLLRHGHPAAARTDLRGTGCAASAAGGNRQRVDGETLLARGRCAGQEAVVGRPPVDDRRRCRRRAHWRARCCRRGARRSTARSTRSRAVRPPAPSSSSELPIATSRGSRRRCVGTIWSVDAGVPVFDIRPMTDIVARSLGVRRFALALLSAFGVVALALAVVGLYSVLSVRSRAAHVRARGAARPSARGPRRSCVSFSWTACG